MRITEFKTFRRRSCSPLFALLAIFPFLTFIAEAADRGKDLTELSLEDLVRVEVVFSASKSEQKTIEAPASISIITAKEIKAQGYRNLNDLLRSVRDFFIIDDREYSLIGMRGFGSLGGYNNRILMLVDGHRINDGLYDYFLTGRSDMVDIDLVERVEIIRGPASSLYGSSAFLGIVSVITRKGKSAEGLALSTAGGSLGTIQGGARWGGSDGSGFSWLAQASLFDSAGNKELYYPEYDAPSTNNGVAENCDAEQGRHAYLSLGLEDWTLRGAYNYRKKIIPTGAYGTTFNDPGNFTSGERFYSELVYRHDQGEDWELTGRIHADYSGYVGNYIQGSGPTREVNVDYGDGSWWGSEIQWTVKTLPKNKITLGAEVRDYFQQDQGNYMGPVTTLEDHRSFTLWALYAQDEIRVFPELLLNLGGRYDDYSTFGGQLVPRGALIFQPWERTTLKFLGGAAFRAPNAYELYYNDGNTYYKANPNLIPETIQTYEVDWEQSFMKHHRFTLSLFHYSAENLISQVTDTSDGLLVFRNIGRASANGVGGEYQFQSPDGVQARISYTFQRAQDDITGKWLEASPEHLAKGSLRVPLSGNRLSVAGELQYTGASLGSTGPAVEGYLLANLKINADSFFLEGMDASLSVYNLFDTRYAQPTSASLLQNSLPQDGLTFWASLGYKL